MTTKSTQIIQVNHQPTQAQLNHLGVFSWPTWSKEVSKFPWTYDEQETCYFLEGDVVVIPDGGEAVSMGKGDLVTFPAGMSCTWEIKSDVRKHYQFG
ncbi:MAG: cupin domain-containing protein [Symploca sp. SIO3E6]|nr:cupin domain-containing protein [Caldora sp. SIO3E6]